MGRGLGPTQQRILDHLDTAGLHGTTVRDLADTLNSSQRQIRGALYALRDRGLVYTRVAGAGITEGHGTRGRPGIDGTPRGTPVGLALFAWTTEHAADMLELDHLHREEPNTHRTSGGLPSLDNHHRYYSYEGIPRW